MKLNKYSIGIGDRFGQQGKAQLDAVKKASNRGVTITPVWNKSYREHELIGTRPMDTRREADDAVRTQGWVENYFVDALLTACPSGRPNRRPSAWSGPGRWDRSASPEPGWPPRRSCRGRHGRRVHGGFG